jgi:transposase-like protein
MAHEPKTLQEAIQYFADPNNCIDYLANRRWKDSVPECPTCGSREVSFMPSRRVWQCKTRHPKCQFSIKVGTIFEDSPIGLDKWLTAMWMMANCRNGVSSWEIHRTLGVTQKSAWFMLQRIRFAMQSSSSKKFGGPGNEVEADETFVGGRAKNMHASRRAMFKAARESANYTGDANYINKTTVWGVLDREQRKVRATVVPKVNRESLQAAVLNQVEHGSKIYTDEASVYKSLPQEYTHEFVNHMERYVNGQVHTNGLENFWSLTKRTLSGTYVAVEPFHLHRYLDEQMFRYNNRLDENGNKRTDAERFSLVVSQIIGKRLTYAEVTGKVDATPF